MRLFIALWPHASERRRLAALAARLPERWRPMPVAGLHLTLAFLGEQPRSRLPWLAAVLARQGGRVPAVRLDRLEAWGEGHLSCAAGDATPALRAWQGRLAAMLAAGGLRPERRAFVPHVTLAACAVADRAASGASRPRGRPIRPPVGPWAACLALVESRPHRPGRPGRADSPWAVARYRVLMAVPAGPR